MSDIECGDDEVALAYKKDLTVLLSLFFISSFII